ncbi:hypothetical protein INE81_02057 [Bacteroides salyersiae]|nr:hypothetical protein INE81_02057 [Bacteroides salyersiae]
MRTIIIVLFFNIISIINVNSCNLCCDINIDSLFRTNLMKLKELVKDSSKYVVVQERNSIKFLYVISLLSGKFISDPHNVVVNSITIAAIEDWYQKKKIYITCEKIKKAYSLLEPPMFNTVEDVEKYSNELEQLEIKDE